jgi:hypothetical protein
MRASNYRIQVTSDSVDVECDDSFQSTRTSRFFFGGVAVGCALFLLYGSCFGHGQNPNIWVMLADSRPGSTGFAFNVIDAVLIVVLVVFFLLVGIRYFLPFGERLHCDRSTLTWSKIPWVSFGNRWVTRSLPLSEILRASYGIVYKSKGIYGILLEAEGKPWKLFWGIETPEANRILLGLKGLGVNVHHDPEMRESIRETLRDLRSQL